MSYSILIVDDSATTRAVIKRTLALSGLEVAGVREASNGKAALEAIELQMPDLVMLDLNMPEMDGLELTERIRADARFSMLPVVIVSSEATPLKVAMMKAKGVNDYITKPFTPEQIRDVASRVLAKAA